MKTYKFKIYGHDYEAKVVRREDDEIVISVNGQEYKAYLEPSKRSVMVKPTPILERKAPVAGEATKISGHPDEVKSIGCVKAPLPGTVLKVSVKQGDEVKAGDTVLILEAMKMQNQIAATTAGKIEEIMVTEGDSVQEGQELVRIA
jgi:biotin carboxyl carrier protein